VQPHSPHHIVDWRAVVEEIYPPRRHLYFDLEYQAIEIRGFTTHVVPGLLQTESYARATLTAVLRQTPQIQHRALEFRMHRQWRTFEQSDPPRCQFILDEAILRRIVGGVAVMREQLQHLLLLSEIPLIDIRVLPFSAGHLVESAELNLFRQSDKTWKGCIEDFAETQVFIEPLAVEWLMEVWQVLTENTLSGAESRKAISDMLEQFHDSDVIALS
jgi:hypothetical protein